MEKLKILLLCNRPEKNADASTVTDHLNAFLNFSKNEVFCLSFLRELPARINLSRFDIVVIHYSIAIGYLSEHYINAEAKQRIKEYSGLKVVFIQDEYRAVDIVIDALQFMGIDLLFTCVPDGEIEKVYSSKFLPNITKVNNLTGYVPKHLLNKDVPQVKDRPIDIGYRTRKPPFWLGELSVEKWQIADKMISYSEGKGLKLDISYQEGDRIYGEKWIEFMSSCKTMLGVESGASVFDFKGELQKRVDQYVEKHPGVEFKEVQKLFLEPYEGKIRLNQISPRCFEAAVLKTVMVLYEGEYSGILTQWRHYIPLKKDFSNYDEVLDYLQNDEKLQIIADQTYKEVACNPKYTYQHFVTKFDEVVDKEIQEKSPNRAQNPYTRFQYNIDLLFSYKYITHRLVSRIVQRVLLGTFLRKIIFGTWGRIPLNAREVIRPFLRLLGR